MYLLIKHAHAGFAALTLLLFVSRFALANFKPAWNQTKAFNVVAHSVYGALVACAAILCVMLYQYPLYSDWVSAKLVGLIVFVGLGIVATRKKDVKVFGLALLAFFYTYGVAKSHSALSWFGLIFAS